MSMIRLYAYDIKIVHLWILKDLLTSKESVDIKKSNLKHVVKQVNGRSTCIPFTTKIFPT